MPTTRSETVSKTLAVGGNHIRYVDSGGDGATVLLIHAGVFADWFAPLTAERALIGHRVIDMTRAGYDGEPLHGDPLSIADHAGHAATLLDALNAGPAHVLAHSSGCVIAMQLALDHPQAVSSLSLSEPPLLDVLADPADAVFLHEVVGPILGETVAKAHAGDLAGAFDLFLRTLCGPDYRQVITAALGEEGLRRAEEHCAAFFTSEMPALAGWSFDTNAAASITQPVLLIQGDSSSPAEHRLIAHLADLLPQAQVNTLEGQDHLLPLRDPSRLASLVDTFTQTNQTTS